MKNFVKFSARKIVLLCCLILIIVSLVAQFFPLTFFAGDKPLAKAPYPPSLVIKSVKWDFNNIIRLAPGSDLWPVTWAQDDKLYVSWGDGGGFGGSNRNGRVSMGIARIEGGPTDFTTENINGGISPVVEGTWDCAHCGKPGSILSVDGVLYLWVSMQNASQPNSKLAWSDDFGKTWRFSDWVFQGDGKFIPGAFANFGKDYIDARDDYVYIYGNDRSNWSNLYLARVVKNKIQERSDYEFFNGKDELGNVVWSSDVNERKKVASDPDGIGALAIVYSPAIKRYILTSHHGDYVGRFGFFDSPTPWGPWTTVAYYNNWNNYGAEVSGMPHSFPAKWISKDGTEMHMIFSGRGDLDSFNLIKVNLEL